MVRNARLWLILIMLQVALAMPGRCGHEEMQNFTTTRRKLQRLNETVEMATRTTAWSPIRIQIYYGALSISASVESRLKSAIDGAINWFTKVLKVRPISAPWQIEETTCGSTAFTGSILTDSFTSDYVFFIYGDSEDNNLAGAAMYCQQDADTGQPVVGYFYFNGRSHELASDEQVLSTIIHEMTHALGFAPSLYDEYLRSDGTKYNPLDILITDTTRGVTTIKLVLPNVLAKARATFGCSSLNGLELETQGSSGTVGAHWEKRLMYNDYMVADADVYDIAYTDITAALFKDSGWYDVDYEYTNPLLWGQQKGCSFISQKCIVNSKPITSEFCLDNTEEQMCDFQSIRKGICNIVTYSQSLPTAYQYFTSPTIGGSDQYIDFCPIVKPYSNGDCRDPTTVLLTADWGEEAGETARCLTGTYSQSGASREHAGCHKVTCSGTTASVMIGSTTVTCPAEGGDVPVTGYSGVVHCPPNGILCADIPCVNNCYGFGYCQNGQCVCDDGTESCQLGFSSDATVMQLGLLLLAI